MNDAFILAGIRDVARKHVGWEGPIEPDMRLVEDLSLDSIKLLTLAIEVENRFQICLDPERDHELITVRDLVAAISHQISDTQKPEEENSHRDTEDTE
ncbi:MAG: hypothetical protein DRJ61_02820 [Acidobacteria bacterium]|nr:MAG: hypothetical protein DRJ61_02820 [Acidobacteriota bacterium]